MFSVYFALHAPRRGSILFSRCVQSCSSCRFLFDRLSQSHALSLAKEKKIEALRSALAISSGFQEVGFGCPRVCLFLTAVSLFVCLVLNAYLPCPACIFCFAFADFLLLCLCLACACSALTHKCPFRFHPSNLLADLFFSSS